LESGAASGNFPKRPIRELNRPKREANRPNREPPGNARRHWSVGGLCDISVVEHGAAQIGALAQGAVHLDPAGSAPKISPGQIGRGEIREVAFPPLLFEIEPVLGQRRSISSAESVQPVRAGQSVMWASEDAAARPLVLSDLIPEGPPSQTDQYTRAV
jgi:hypothetical protein